jgi:hypothetical protein
VEATDHTSHYDLGLFGDLRNRLPPQDALRRLGRVTCETGILTAQHKEVAAKVGILCRNGGDMAQS